MLPVLFFCTLLYVTCTKLPVLEHHDNTILLVYGCVVCVYHCWAAHGNKHTYKFTYHEKRIQTSK